MRKEIKAEWEQKELTARRRTLGNIRFIGELFKHKMLTVRIVHECLERLLRYKKDAIAEAREESLECLCKLLTTVGKHFEDETNKFLKNPKKPQLANSITEKR